MSDVIDSRLRQVTAQADRRRSLRPMRAAAGDRPLPPGRIEVAGRVLRNFSSNDYLALARDPRLIARSNEWTRLYGCGAAASRLACGDVEPFARVEEKIARLKGSPAALIFNSGYQANATVLPALLDSRLHGEPPLVFTDRLNHASLHAGIRAAGLKQIRYRHNDLDHLADLLDRHTGPAGEGRGSNPPARFIIAETVFGMDGDQADVAGLCALAERHDAFLYLDEAHATGLFGSDGLGLTAGQARVDLAMGTFGKAFGAFGAYVAGGSALRDFLINRCPGFIYATALPPGVLGAVDAALDLLPAMNAVRARTLANAEKLRRGLRDAGFDCGRSTTQIVPVLLGGDADALRVAAALEEAGFLAIAIRPPTVPEGTGRIRFSVTAAHDEQDIADLIAALRDIADDAGMAHLRAAS